MIQWIVDNYEHVLAVIGAAYTLARLIVKLTPTPKDDEALEKVTAFLRPLTFLFGLKAKAPAPEKPADKQSGRAKLELVVVLGCLGCVSVTVTTPIAVTSDKSKAAKQEVTGRQPLSVLESTARTESSSGTSNSTTQTADAKLEVPISATGQ